MPFSEQQRSPESPGVQPATAAVDGVLTINVSNAIVTIMRWMCPGGEEEAGGGWAASSQYEVRAAMVREGQRIDFHF